MPLWVRQSPRVGLYTSVFPLNAWLTLPFQPACGKVPCCADEAAELPVPPEALPDCPAPCCKDDDADPAADGAGDGCAVATGTSCAGWFTAASGESHTSVPSSRACFWMRVRSSTPRTTLRMAAIPVMVAANTSARQTRYSPFAFKNALMLFIFPRPLLAVRPKHRAQNLPPGIFNRTVRVVYAISVARTDWIYAQSGQKYCPVLLCSLPQRHRFVLFNLALAFCSTSVYTYYSRTIMSITIIICEVETMKAPLVITMARELLIFWGFPCTTRS